MVPPGKKPPRPPPPRVPLREPVPVRSEAERQAMLVEGLRQTCPSYWNELHLAGFSDEELAAPSFSHIHHVARFAARALREGREQEARAVFAVWARAEPKGVYFPAKEFAEACYELRVQMMTAMPLVPGGSQDYFAICLRQEDPDYWAEYGY